MPYQPRVLRQLSVPESLRLLGSVSLGRIVFTDQALPAIRPVNHVVQDGDVVIRTHVGAKVTAAAHDGVVVAYEADAIDPVQHLGWSVIVTGTARLVSDPAEIARYEELLRPWTHASAVERVIRIHTDLITGFELLASPLRVVGAEPAAIEDPAVTENVAVIVEPAVASDPAVTAEPSPDGDKPAAGRSVPLG